MCLSDLKAELSQRLHEYIISPPVAPWDDMGIRDEKPHTRKLAIDLYAHRQQTTARTTDNTSPASEKLHLFYGIPRRPNDWNGGRQHKRNNCPRTTLTARAIAESEIRAILFGAN